MDTARKTLAGLILLLAPHAMAGEPPPTAKNLPGVTRGSMTNRWIAPYVSATVQRIGSAQRTTVCWFSADGKVLRELTERVVTVQPGFVSTYTDGKMTVHAVNGSWRLVLPPEKVHNGYVTATVDSRVFVHQWHPDRDRIAVDVYLGGKLRSSIGPFLRYKGDSVHLGANGSLALLTWKTPRKEIPHLVLADSDGNVRCRVDCDPNVRDPIPAPDGAGALVRQDTGAFEFWRSEGKVATFDIKPNAHFMRWMPKVHHALFSTSLGEADRYRVVDCAAGRTVWDVPHPGGSHTTECCSAIENGFVLLSGLDSVRVGNHEGPVRTVYALRTATGALEARWRPWPYCPGFRIDSGRLVKLGKRLFVVANDEFAEFDTSDIAARKNGWR